MVTNFAVFFILLFSVNNIYASDYDDETVDTLKIEANHNIERLMSFKYEAANNKIFENEREKGLGDFLEDQEKWDLIRERGLREYLRLKYRESAEGKSEAYKRDLKEKTELLKEYENSRKKHVKARDKVRSQQTRTLSELEADELKIYSDRPRFDSARRGKGKWTAGAFSKHSSGSASGSAGIGGGFQPPAPANDFPPPQPPDFPPAPAPYEGFEDIPPPPIYDNTMNTGIPYDPSFGGGLSIPPPPPPPPDFDF